MSTKLGGEGKVMEVFCFPRVRYGEEILQTCFEVGFCRRRGKEDYLDSLSHEKTVSITQQNRKLSFPQMTRP